MAEKEGENKREIMGLFFIIIKRGRLACNAEHDKVRKKEKDTMERSGYAMVG